MVSKYFVRSMKYVPIYSNSYQPSHLIYYHVETCLGKLFFKEVLLRHVKLNSQVVYLLFNKLSSMTYHRDMSIIAPSLIITFTIVYWCGSGKYSISWHTPFTEGFVYNICEWFMDQQCC